MPPLVRNALAREVTELRSRSSDPARAQESVDIARLALDLRMRHTRREEIDLHRLELWVRQLAIHLESADAAGIAGDLVCLDLVRDRVAHAYPSKAMSELDEILGQLRIAAVDGDAEPAVKLAAEARKVVAELQPL